MLGGYISMYCKSLAEDVNWFYYFPLRSFDHAGFL